jgi:hypothetical protein
MKLIKHDFLIRIDKIQIKTINDRVSVRVSSKIDLKNHNHYFFYLPDSLFIKVKKVLDKISSARISTNSPRQIAESKGKLFRYSVKELYLDNGKIISL